MKDFAFASTDNLDDLGTTAVKYENNLAALRLLKELEVENRTEATLHEQTILSKYVGWGDSALLKRAFPNGAHYSHIPPADEIKELLTDEEVKQLRASSLNAHYTTIPIIRAIYDGLLHMGLHYLHHQENARLRVLEPAAGIGHFIGAMPAELKSRSDCAAVELDSLSARITKLLYPSATVYAEGFETANLPSDWFDLVISNVPFGNYKVCDVSFREPYLRAAIHDYYFAKALRVVRPGGVIAFITSRYTLDKQDARLRSYLATHAELLAAVRLPNDAFAANAGTQVVTDLILLRKRLSPDKEAAAREAWIEAQDTTIIHETGTPMNITLNRIMIADPSLVLGQAIVSQHGMYGRNEFTVKSDGRDLAESLTETLKRVLPVDLFGATSHAESHAAPVKGNSQAIPKKDNNEWIGLSLQQEMAEVSAVRAGFEQARASHLISIYAAAKKVIKVQMDNGNDESLAAAQSELNALYDRFRIRYGYINSKQNLAAFRKSDGLLAFLRALEEPVNGSGQFRKTPLFTKRTIRPATEKTFADNAHEALLLCLNERGRIDLERIASLCRKDAGAVVEELRGAIFHTPGGGWVTRDEYLSGNVCARLKEAEAAAHLDDTFKENVEALRIAQPAPLGAGEIVARLGAAWIPTEVIEQFARFLVPLYRGHIRYLAPTAQWVVDAPSVDASLSVEASQTWGTKRIHALSILEDALNLRRTVVYDQIDEKTRIVNQTETIAAQAKLQDMKEKFSEWVWQDARRESELCRIYNEQFNTTRERRYDGSHLTLPGASTEIELRPHQKDAVWRILQSKTTLIGHAVGSGKTLVSIAAAHELRRFEIARKSMIVVPKHVVPQWAQEAQRLYPGLRMLTTDAKDFTKQTRGETLSRIATGDWDLIIVPHPSFKVLPVSAQTANKFINDEIERLRDHITELKGEGGRENKRSIKQLEKTLKRFEAKLKTQNAEIKRDDQQTITFEELGVEALFVDECFPYETLIHTNRGLLEIGEIVERKLPVKVLAVDTVTGRLEWKPIVRWLPKKLSGNLVRVTHEHGSFICTPNHKIWTEENGYVKAGDLSANHCLRVLRQELCTAGAEQEISSETFLQQEMRGSNTPCQRGISSVSSLPKAGVSTPRSSDEKILQQRMSQGGSPTGDNQDLRILPETIQFSLSGRDEQPEATLLQQFLRVILANVSTRKIGKIVESFGASARQLLARKEASGSFRTDEAQQSNARPGGERESQPSQAWANIPLPRRQRSTDRAAVAVGASARTAHRILNPDGCGQEPLPVIAELLQGGYSGSFDQISYRSGRADSQTEEMEISRPPEGVRLAISRVVSVEILEPAGDGDARRSGGGDQTVYDLEVADHHNYFANGALVSNCHIYKNLYFPTKMSRITGLANSESQQAFDMFVKVQWLLEQQGRVVFLTGTPVSNTLCEVWIMMRYLQLDLLKELGLDHFDAWAQAFAETTTGVEMKPDGSGFRVNTRFNKFVNLPELSRLWRQCLDVRTPEQLNLPRPKIVGGSPIIVSVPASDELIEFVGELSRRSEKVRAREVHPSMDNMLKITSEGRKAALDMRLVKPALPESPNNKIDALVERVGKIYRRTAVNRGAQIIFCDLATPKGKGGAPVNEKEDEVLNEAA
jgi:N12 class adenine-specific DNA methylase